MQKTINSYKDENGFTKSLLSLYNELLKSGKGEEDSLKIIEELYKTNIQIDKEKKDEYLNEVKILNEIKKQQKYEDYNSSIVMTNSIDESIKLQKSSLLDFYITYIEENIKDDMFLDILPKENDKDSKNIFMQILNHYKSNIVMIQQMLRGIKSKDEESFLLEELIMPKYIFDKILNYKESLKLISHDEQEQFKNNLVFFMNGNLPYIVFDTIDYPEIIPSIEKLLNSIINGTFKNITKFVDYPGLLEVKDLRNKTRVIFERYDHNSYCIVGAIVNKSETTSIYRERLNNRFNIYKNNIDNIKKDINIKQLINGERNE